MFFPFLFQLEEHEEPIIFNRRAIQDLQGMISIGATGINGLIITIVIHIVHLLQGLPQQFCPAFLRSPKAKTWSQAGCMWPPKWKDGSRSKWAALGRFRAFRDLPRRYHWSYAKISDFPTLPALDWRDVLKGHLSWITPYNHPRHGSKMLKIYRIFRFWDRDFYSALICFGVNLPLYVLHLSYIIVYKCI